MRIERRNKYINYICIEEAIYSTVACDPQDFFTKEILTKIGGLRYTQ